MKLTAKGRYAVTAVCALAAKVDRMSHPVSMRELSEEQGIPLAFLEQVFGKLRKAGIVQSTRGASGGYALAVSPDALSVRDVIAAVDIDIRAQGCTPDMKSACTGSGTKCLTHDLWTALEGHIEGFLAEVRISDVISDRGVTPAQAGTSPGVAEDSPEISAFAGMTQDVEEGQLA